MASAPEEIEASVLFEMRGPHVALVTLNRPSARNAVDGAMARAIDHIVDTTEADDAVRVVVLASSHDSVFCAGADLAEIARGNAAALITGKGFGGLTEAQRRKPWIAAVDGAAFAGGCELALACDMIVGSKKARFGLPEVKRGLFAGAAGPYRLPRALPRNIALELVATGDPLDAGRASELGLLNRLVPPGEALDAALALADTIAQNAPYSVRESLNLARQAFDLNEAELRALSRQTMDRVFASEDAQEGPRAFLEKRPAVWVGR